MKVLMFICGAAAAMLVFRELSGGNEQLWPSTPQDKRYGYSRLNIGIMQGYRFGRLVEKREP